MNVNSGLNTELAGLEYQKRGLKSPDAYASCGFDPHPGHQFSSNNSSFYFLFQLARLFQLKVLRAPSLCAAIRELQAARPAVLRGYSGGDFVKGGVRHVVGFHLGWSIN